jgi:hypothetical protein
MKTNLNTLNRIQSLQFANVYNLYSRTAKTVLGSCEQVKKDIAFYKKKDYIKIIPFDGIPLNKNFDSWSQFYSVTLAGSKAIDRVKEYRQKVSKSSNSQEHESMKIDVVRSFIDNFPDYEFDFNYNANFKGIRPDIFIKAKHIYNNKEYTFFVEVERSKKEMTYIFKDKIVKYNKFIKDGLFDKKGFHSPKVLFFCAYNQYPFNLRPQQYGDEQYSKYFVDIQRLFGNLLNLLKEKGVSDKYFRFAMFPEAITEKLKEDIFYFPNGKKIKLID